MRYRIAVIAVLGIAAASAIALWRWAVVSQGGASAANRVSSSKSRLTMLEPGLEALATFPRSAPTETFMNPEFPEGLEWLNTDKPLRLKDLRGKIVLLDFWTYCCINCMHIIPDLKRLEAKYPKELVVIGVHSAKFYNEKDADNIRQAILRYEIEHPVVNDRDFAVWNLFGASAWPTLFLIDPDGRVVGYMSGEGIYEPLDEAIGELVRKFEAAGKLNRKPIALALEKNKRPPSLLSYPGKIVADEKSGRLFFTDSNHNRVIVASLSGAIQEVVGEGNIGLKDGDFQTAQFFRPQGLCHDPANDVLYVADTENHTVRKIDLKARSVSTIAGNGKQAPYPPTGGVGKAVSLSSPWDVLLLGDTLYVAMAGTHQLWSIDLKTQRAEPYAGTAGENLRDGPREQALLAQPSGLTTDGRRIYFADSEVSALRYVDTRENTVGTVIGEGLFEFGDVDGTYPQARFQHPLGVAYKDGYVYMADTYNHKIKRVDPKTRKAETFIGTGKRGMDDGPAKQASLNEPNGLTFATGKMYIADTNNHLIRVFDLASGKLSTLRLTGIEKLASRKIPKFTGRETRLSAQQVAPGAKALHVEIRLPKGTKFNRGAPFRIAAMSDRPEAVSIGPLNISAPSSKLTIPISPKSGEANITVEMSINYCAERNEGLCYFKEARLVVPMKVTPSGASSVSVSYAL